MTKITEKINKAVARIDKDKAAKIEKAKENATSVVVDKLIKKWNSQVDPAVNLNIRINADNIDTAIEIWKLRHIGEQTYESGNAPTTKQVSKWTWADADDYDNDPNKFSNRIRKVIERIREQIPERIQPMFIYGEQVCQTTRHMVNKKAQRYENVAIKGNFKAVTLDKTFDLGRNSQQKIISGTARLLIGNEGFTKQEIQCEFTGGVLAVLDGRPDLSAKDKEMVKKFNEGFARMAEQRRRALAAPVTP